MKWILVRSKSIKFSTKMKKRRSKNRREFLTKMKGTAKGAELHVWCRLLRNKYEEWAPWGKRWWNLKLLQQCLDEKQWRERNVSRKVVGEKTKAHIVSKSLQRIMNDPGVIRDKHRPPIPGRSKELSGTYECCYEQLNEYGVSDAASRAEAGRRWRSRVVVLRTVVLYVTAFRSQRSL